MSANDGDNILASVGPESSSFTDSKLVRFSHKWYINHFSYHLEDEESENPYIKSSKFSPYATNEQLEFTLRLYPKNKEDAEEFVGIYLYLESCDREEVTVQSKISIIGEDGEKHNTESNQFKFSVSKKRGWHKFITREHLLDADSGLLSNDRLTIHCEIGYITESSTITGPKNNFKCLSHLAEVQALSDVGSLLQSGKFSDVILVLEGKEYRVHKNILSTRSTFFSSLLDHKETNENKVEITDMKAEVFDELLKYIYNGAIGTIDQYGTELFVAADKYGLKQLKSICEESLCLKMSDNSVVGLLVLADKHNSEQLKTCAINYITMNASSVLETNSWKNIIDTHPKLYHEAISRLLPKLSRPISLSSKKCNKKTSGKIYKRAPSMYLTGKIRRNA